MVTTEVWHFGDLFSAKAAPAIDVANGGSAVEFPETLASDMTNAAANVRAIYGELK